MSASKAVSFYGLTDEWAAIRTETEARISAVFDHGRFVEGPEIDELEETISAALKAPQVVTCGSGTTALLMAMMALELRPGDEVIIPSFTFAAPVECAMLLGALPVFADVAYPSGLIDPEAVRAAITPRTKAIVAVSLFGMVPDFDTLSEIAKSHGLYLIEDAAQSYGAEWRGKPSGTLGHVNCLSFFPTKVLGGAGDGGAVVTDDPELARRLRMIRDHGQDTKNSHACVGLNGRLSSIAAAALLVRHRHLEPSLLRRRAIGTQYDTAFQDRRFLQSLAFHLPDPHVLPARSQYAILVRDRDRLRDILKAEGIGTAIYYPKPLHLQPAFRHLGDRALLGSSERMAAEVLALPIHPGLERTDIDLVTDALARLL